MSLTPMQTRWLRRVWTITPTTVLAAKLRISKQTLYKYVWHLNLPAKGIGRPRKIDWAHGTAQGYKYYGCRCDRCRESHTIDTRHRVGGTRRGRPDTMTPTTYRCECGRLNCPDHPQPWMAA